MWVWSSVSGAEVAVLLAVTTMLTLTISHYRHYGLMRVARVIGALGFSLYVAALFVYTQLPVPDVASTAWCEAHGYASPQLTPLASFETIMLRADEIGWGATITSTLGLQVMLNVLLFVPWGIFLVGYFHRSIGLAVLSGVALSFGIEFVQATGMMGIYPCAYRLGDVDDLITNTAGALIGALVAPLILFWMPKAKSFRTHIESPQPLTVQRRVTGFFINVAAIWCVSKMVMMVTEAVWKAAVGRIPYEGFEWLGLLVHCMTVAGVMLIPAILGNGSFGMWVMRITPYWVTQSNNISAGTRSARMLRSMVIAGPLMIAGIPWLPNASALFMLVVIITAVMTPWSREHRALAGFLTSSGIRDMRVGRRC